MKYVLPISYIRDIQSRNTVRYFVGLVPRIRNYLLFSFVRHWAIYRGAIVGENSIIPWKLAKKANSNLIVGNNVIIETDDIDLRSKVIIKDNVIINKGVSIIRVSHYIDDNTIYATKYYQTLVIESYVWLATGCTIMPSCTLVGYGAIGGGEISDCEGLHKYGGICRESS